MQRILAADIGGTSSRFGFFELTSEADEPRLLSIARLPTTESDSLSALLERLFSEQRPFATGSCDLIVLAVPGPVQGRFCRPPNIKWDIDLYDINKVGLWRGALLNDFAAQAFACRSRAVRDARVLQASRADAQLVVGGAVAVIGAGTGLGHCALVPDGRGGNLAVPSEAGHVGFPFVGEAEHAYGEYVRRVTSLAYCHGDAVVSGPGLSRLHAFLTGEVLTPATLAARLDNHPRTVEWFARFYGRACRNYALSVLALGGIYVSGGVAAKNPMLVEHPAFLEEFRLSPSHADLLAGLPVLLNVNEDSGVFGAALFGAQRLRRRS
ncbi:MAG: glucokinase [Humidesulfovibrio sp.]|nr:glucokinase [Desulfovibrio sp.]MDO9082285.1 glucokinase [Humidesulfovibrio sp.]